MGLRLAHEPDAEALVALINAAFRKGEGHIIEGDRIDLDSVRSLFEKGEFLVAEDHGTVVGCVYLERRGERNYLGLLSVSPERQKTGIGSMLMGEAERRCARASSRAIDLKTIDLRIDNREFYKRRGYVETGTEPFPADVTTKLPCCFVTMSKSIV